MKKILIFVAMFAMCLAHAGAAVRDGGATQRTTQKRISTTPIVERTNNTRTVVLKSDRTTINRSTTLGGTSRNQTNLVNRAAKTTVDQPVNVSARAAAVPNQTLVLETRTGTVYETCKSAFFTCMDQFCALKNDDYRRCSCSKRITDIERQRETLTDAGQQLTVFTENLDIVGLTAAQATAMHTASEGENALSNDTSASKALLQAIMNSISGGDTTVSGKYSDLNTINMSYDLTGVFGGDANQIIASYNGQDLYTATYSQCRHAVAADCNNASLQRAINAYLMAIEQDCNTVQTALDEKRSQMKTAIREGSAMLDLARVENRRKHNSDDITTCINNVENAILSEEVCGANYHKCLDNGEFIDISTGAPIAGVVRFYELGNLLTFSPGVDAANQQLSKRANNRTFVLNFEKKTKKFAEPALDKCVEIADDVWSAYLDKAMLAIYYAQQAKVSEIKQGCFDFVSSCYTDSNASITAAMSELIGSGLTILEPDKISLTTQMCSEYVQSCNNMFDDNIIEEYVNNRQNVDTLTACRAVVKQCFDKYGGDGYENFYYPYSGLFAKDSENPYLIEAGDWFALYDNNTQEYKSPCAKQLTTIDACNDKDIIESAFGGFDRIATKKGLNETDQLAFNIASDGNGTIRYGVITKDDPNKMRNRMLRPTGVATEVYNQIVDFLTIQCTNIDGRFVERQFIKENLYGGKNENDICLWYPGNSDLRNNYVQLAKDYGIFTEDAVPDNFTGENMCPRDYNLNVYTPFWGACLCWENGARRSKNGKSAICVPELPAKIRATESGSDDTTNNNESGTESGSTEQTRIMDDLCYEIKNDTNQVQGQMKYDLSSGTESKFNYWCTQSINTAGQVCPFGYTAQIYDSTDDGSCKDSSGESYSLENLIPETILQGQIN